MRRIFATFVCGLMFVSIATAQTTQPQGAVPQTSTLQKFDPSLVDASKDPCEDFFQYTCSRWTAAHPIPPDLNSNGTGTPLFLWNQTILRETMEKAAANKSTTGAEKQIGDFWQSCMDMPGRNAKGKQWLASSLNVVDEMKSKQDLARVVAELHQQFPAAWQANDNQTNAPLFGFGPMQDYADSSLVVAGLDQAGLGLPTRDYYLNDDERSTKLREAYLKHIQQMFELSGEPSAKAAAGAKTVLSIETALAKAQMDNVKRRDPENTYNKRSLADIKKAVPSFNFDEYLKLVRAPTPKFYIVSTPPYLNAMENEIKTRSVDDLKTYLRWWTIHSAANTLGDDFVNANFDFYGRTLSGTQQLLPLWRRCVSSADRNLGEALGQAYVNAAFSPESKAKALELVSDLRSALKNNVNQLTWMSPETKKQALGKLDAMEQKIGYPNKWRDYSSVRIAPDAYLANVKAATNFELHRQLKKIGEPLDRTEWTMTPATINAYNDPQMNSINFPAGILQLPFFNAEQDAATNYGGIGMIIGHEIIHGFDDQGRKFDAKGNLRDWWTEADAKAYDERGKCLSAQYTGEVSHLGVKRNGLLTQGEDTADNGGLQLAMMALEEKYKRDGKSLDTPESDGLTARQRFFLGYAFGWCRTTRPETERLQILSDPHSLARYRVNTPVSNMQQFQKAFGCKAGQPMVHEPACRVW